MEPVTYTVNEIKNPTSNIYHLGENPAIAGICIMLMTSLVERS